MATFGTPLSVAALAKQRLVFGVFSDEKCSVQLDFKNGIIIWNLCWYILLFLLCIIYPDSALCFLALHEHVVSDIIRRLSTSVSLALSALPPMFFRRFCDIDNFFWKAPLSQRPWCPAGYFFLIQFENTLGFIFSKKGSENFRLCVFRWNVSRKLQIVIWYFLNSSTSEQLPHSCVIRMRSNDFLLPPSDYRKGRQFLVFTILVFVARLAPIVGALPSIDETFFSVEVTCMLTFEHIKFWKIKHYFLPKIQLVFWNAPVFLASSIRLHDHRAPGKIGKHVSKKVLNFV